MPTLKIQQFLFGKNHSWALVGQNLARAFLQRNWKVDLISTDGVEEKFVPKDLKPYLVSEPAGVYDAQISYTAPHNFPRYLSCGKANRFGIWCYEFYPYLPKGEAKYYKFCDQILAPSEFAKDIFVQSKVPADRVTVVPHGIHLSDYENLTPFPLKTKKTRKILVNIGQGHLRKNIKNLFKSYLEAFTDQDDVCLVAKIAFNNPDMSFGVNPKVVLEDLLRGRKHAPEVELITNYVPNINDLYAACDVVYTLSYAEGFYMPGLEAFAAGKICVAPRWGGQLDYMNDQNSILIEGEKIKANKVMQYWTPSPYNCVFNSTLSDASSKLRYLIDNFEELQAKFAPEMQKTAVKHTWDQVAEQIEGLMV